MKYTDPDGHMLGALLLGPVGVVIVIGYTIFLMLPLIVPTVNSILSNLPLGGYYSTSLDPDPSNAPSPSTGYRPTTPEEQIRDAPEPFLRSDPRPTTRHKDHAKRWARQKGISGTDEETWNAYVESIHGDIRSYEMEGKGKEYLDRKYPDRTSIKTPDDWLVAYDNTKIYTKYYRGADGFGVAYNGSPRFIPK
jgi:hypothetical protein